MKSLNTSITILLKLAYRYNRKVFEDSLPFYEIGVNIFKILTHNMD